MTYTLIPNRNLTVVTSDFRVLTIAADNPNWSAIMECVKHDDEAGIIRLMSMKETIKSFGLGVSNRGNIEIQGNTVLYRGEALYGEDVTRILSFIQDGFDTTGMIKFLERKLKNPSKRSVDSLYNFLENKGMPITPRGTFLGYKGVNADYSSKNTGSEPLINGKRLPNGAIDNHIGEFVRMDRRYVCDNFNEPCGPGLHVGSFEYAKSWAGTYGHVMIVQVDPADVVSVPDDEHTKLRVCGYTVVGEETTKMPDVFTDDYVRPDDECACGKDDCVDCNPPEVVDNDSDTYIQDMDSPEAYYSELFSFGYEDGKVDGKQHHKRKYYEEDKGKSFEKNSTMYVDGYLKGYKDGRNGL